MGTVVEVSAEAKEPVVALALDTIGRKKQGFVFVNTKRSAEKVAEDISKKVRDAPEELSVLAEKARTVLSKPTHQCERLANCLKKGIAFHHAGLHADQKALIEEHFRKGSIRMICCTPTLAAGVDLPAFRAIIRDVKRFTQTGMAHIPVLEFLQMAGRAGRPSFDDYGEAIVIANSEAEKEALQEKYLRGEPEDIYSKLAVEPVLRTYVLSLVASRIVRTKRQILDFFGRTFWAYQFKDVKQLERILAKTLTLLTEWDFLAGTDDAYRATVLGKRVAELYLDPLTAHKLAQALERAPEKPRPIAWLHLISSTLEMRPWLRVRVREFDDVQEKMAKVEQHLLEKEPSPFEPEYDDWLNGFKTALMLQDWAEEKDEEYLLDHYDVRPGETRAKLNIADWLCYSLSELARIQGHQPLLKEITKMRLRLRYGVREELLTLLRLEGIGRVRARTMFNAGFKDLGALRKAPMEKLAKLLGAKVAAKVKKQLGEENTTGNGVLA